MQAEVSRISTRSLAQAMDWSLVLISQGIGTEIHQDQANSAYGLLVSPEDYSKAVCAIRQYRKENLGWWRREFFRPGLLFDWGSLAWVILVCLFYWVDAATDLRAVGMMDNTAVASGQWWRLFTAVWLHGDLAHLSANASLGLILLGLTMGSIGTGPGLLAAYLSGVGGNAIAFLVSARALTSLGASGVVMGCLGILTARSFFRRTPYSGKYFIAGLAAGLMLFVLLGLSPGTFIQAHVGGFVTGLLLGLLASLFPNSSRNTLFNVSCGFLFTLLALLPWWLALSR